jgi:hypothetical protein
MRVHFSREILEDDEAVMRSFGWTPEDGDFVVWLLLEECSMWANKGIVMKEMVNAVDPGGEVVELRSDTQDPGGRHRDDEPEADQS